VSNPAARGGPSRPSNISLLHSSGGAVSGRGNAVSPPGTKASSSHSSPGGGRWLRGESYATGVDHGVGGFGGGLMTNTVGTWGFPLYHGGLPVGCLLMTISRGWGSGYPAMESLRERHGVRHRAWSFCRDTVARLSLALSSVILAVTHDLSHSFEVALVQAVAVLLNAVKGSSALSDQPCLTLEDFSFLSAASSFAVEAHPPIFALLTGVPQGLITTKP
jgi:hypothetical protein